MQTARGRKHHDVDFRPREQLVVARKSPRLRCGLSSLQRLRIDVADRDQLGFAGVTLKRVNMILRNTTAADKSEPDLAIDD